VEVGSEKSGTEVYIFLVHIGQHRILILREGLSQHPSFSTDNYEY
jgi:hypothetical protein